MPASMTIALVASSPNVTGRRMLMPASGPMPGSTPTSVPTRQPRNAYHSTSGRNATEKPSSRLSRVASTGLEPHDALRQRRFEQRTEQQIGQYDDAEAQRRSAEHALALDEHEKDEDQRRNGDEKAGRRVERGGGRRHGDDAGGVADIAPVELAQRRALGRANEQDQSEQYHQRDDELWHHAGARHRPCAE